MSTSTCICQSRPSLARPGLTGRRTLQRVRRSLHQPARQLRASDLFASRRRVVSSAAGPAALESSSQQEARKQAAARVKSEVPRPQQLPPPPKSTSLWHVLPYLTKLAVSDAQLYWRLGLAFALMIASKAAGKHAPNDYVSDKTVRQHILNTCCCFAGLMAPLYFKKAVDALATQTNVAASAAVMALLWSGGCRVINGICKELQHPIFTPVAQARQSSQFGNTYGILSHEASCQSTAFLASRACAARQAQQQQTKQQQTKQQQSYKSQNANPLKRQNGTGVLMGSIPVSGRWDISVFCTAATSSCFVLPTQCVCACLQAAGRRVAYHTFSHVLDLDVGFHLERRTGALSRILERGERLQLCFDCNRSMITAWTHYLLNDTSHE